MIMQKTIINDKEVYVIISTDEAKDLIKKKLDKDLVFTDEDEKDDLYDEVEDELDDEEEDEEDNETDSKAYSWSKNINIDSEKIAKNIKDSINIAVESIAGKNGVGGIFNKDNSYNPKSKTSKLLRVIPFMDDEDVHELVQSILNGDESLKDVKIEAILPFMSNEDCDALFIKAINDGNKNVNITAVTPFVSRKCLSLVVDKYINGEYPNLNVDSLYPFLDGKDIKKLFKFILDKKDE